MFALRKVHGNDLLKPCLNVSNFSPYVCLAVLVAATREYLGGVCLFLAGVLLMSTKKNRRPEILSVR